MILYGGSLGGLASSATSIWSSITLVHRPSASVSVNYGSADAYRPSAYENQLPDLVMQQQLPQKNEAIRAILSSARRAWFGNRQDLSIDNASPGLSNVTRPTHTPFRQQFCGP